MSQIQKPLNYPIITGRPGTAAPAAPKPQGQQAGPSFQELLQKSIQDQKPQQITFSRHAQARTEQRGIQLSESDMDRLGQAVGKARDKGLTDTLVLMNNTAFIVNVPNQVVVTVVAGEDTQDAVFTNIDGAVLI